MNTKNFITQFYASKAKPTKFHAFFWGKFSLAPIREKEGYTFFAQADSAALDFELSYKEEQVYLHSEDAQAQLLTENVEELFSNPIHHPEYTLYDNRPSLSDLFPKENIYKSDFKDPEDFEELEAYVEFIQGIDNYYQGLIGINTITTSEENDERTISLDTKYGKLKIQIERELFDLDVLHTLNEFIKDNAKRESTLHLTIDAQMYMLTLLLDKADLAKAKRIGLIV